jgi:type I restriction enzyme S subunit
MPQNIGDNRVLTTEIARITQEDAKRLSRYLVRPGDIVYSRRGDVERRALIRNTEDGWLCGTGCLRVRVGDGVLDPAFTSFYLGHPEVKSWIVRHAIGATMPNLNTSILSALPVVMPPPEEQRRIAELLGTLDDKIELNRQMNETLEAIGSAIFKSWVTDLSHALPPVRQCEPLSEVFEINPSRILGKRSSAQYVDMGNLPNTSARVLGSVTREFTSGMRFRNGDTLVARITPCLENGKTAFVDFLEDKEVAWGSTEFIVLRPKPPLPPEYAYFLARSEEFRAFAISNMSGTSGRQRVPTDCFQNFCIAVPPEPIAMAFGKVAKLLFAKMKSNDEEAKTLSDLRDTLLPKLISGEIRIKQAEKLIGALV